MGEFLSARQTAIIKQLLEKDAYCTAAQVASSLKVSTRTVLRELGECRSWLGRYHIALDSLPGQGIRLAGSPLVRSRLRDLLSGVADSSVLPPPERRALLCATLLLQKDVIKLFTLSEVLGVAESTLSNDLEKSSEWFQDHSIALVRKQGLGVYVEGDELSRRGALAGLFHRTLGDGPLRAFLLSGESEKKQKQKMSALESRMIRFFDTSLLDTLNRLLHEFEEENHLQYVENASVSLILHLAIALYRVRDGVFGQPDSATLRLLQDTPEYAQARILTQKIKEHLGIALPEEEIGIVTMHLRGAKSFLSLRGTSADELTLTANKMLRLASQQSGYGMEESPELLEAIVNHLAAAIHRIQMNLVIRNPLLDEIRNNYPEMFKLARQAAGIVEQDYGIAMPEAEVAYLAMYLGAAAENTARPLKRRLQVAVACPAGMSSSLLLASRLKSEMPRLEVVDILSLSQASRQSPLKHYDLIVTTDPVTSGTPFFVVNPLFPEEDRKKLEEFLDTLPDATPQDPAASDWKGSNWKDWMQGLNDITEGILQVLEGLFVVASDCESPSEAIRAAAQIMGKDHPDVVAAFEERESLGSIVVAEHGLWLLHARTDSARSLHFGVLRFKAPFSFDGQKADTAVVMLAPQNISEKKIDVLRQISRTIAEDVAFLTLLRQGTAEEIYLALEAIFKKYFDQARS